MIVQILQDALFAAIAAIGFAAISKPPRRAYLYCAVIAAAAHSLRFILMSGNVNIVVATAISSFAAGTIAVFLSPAARTPAETFLFPALLPMIPGMYAYRSFGAMVMCILGEREAEFNHYFYLFASNGFTCVAILLGMVTGATVPISIFKKRSFQATR